MRQSSKSNIHQCVCQTCQQHPYSAVAKEHQAINRVVAGLDEKNRRRFGGLLVLQWGHGGMARLIEVTGISRNTICRGRAEVQRADRATAGRVRRAGAGRPAIEKKARGPESSGGVVAGCHGGGSNQWPQVGTQGAARALASAATQGLQSQHLHPPSVIGGTGLCDPRQSQAVDQKARPGA